jgi:hypothetical protein
MVFTRDVNMVSGMAEYLCHRVTSPVPEWTDKPDCFLSEPCRKSWEPEFRRRNISYNPRHMIRL